MSDTPTPKPPKAQYPGRRPKVPPFARYEGTSAWRKYPRRVRAYALFLEAAKQGGQNEVTPA